MATVLVADDVMAERLSVTDHLRRMGHEVIGVDNGERAVAAAIEHRPDLILLDIVMGTLDGYGACKRIKANPDTRDIPVIMMSSKSQESAVFRAKQLGARDYLVKPVTAETLRAALEGLV